MLLLAVILALASGWNVEPPEDHVVGLDTDVTFAGLVRVGDTIDDIASTDPWRPRAIMIQGTGEAEVRHHERLSSVSAERILRVKDNRIKRDGHDREWFVIPEHPTDAVLVQVSVGDGELDFVPDQEWSESQRPTIDAVLSQAHRFLAASLTLAGLI